MAVTLTYDDRLSRVRISVDGLGAGPVAVERSTDQVRWTVVRGGPALTPSAGVVSLDDYEFSAGVPNYYRVSGQSGQITPVDHRLWVKSIARPFLNRPLPVVTDVSPISRPARSGLFSPLGRSLPIAINSARGSRRWTLTVLTRTPSEAETLDLILASGDPLYLQVPPGHNIPGGYVTVGDSDEVPYPGQYRNPDEPRSFVLPLTEVAPPGADVVGATVTWATVLATYPTWRAVLNAHESWASLLEMIGDPSEVIVP